MWKTDKGKGAKCTVNACPERRRCDLKDKAESCATYRAIKVHNLRVSR